MSTIVLFLLPWYAMVGPSFRWRKPKVVGVEDVKIHPTHLHAHTDSLVPNSIKPVANELIVALKSEVQAPVVDATLRENLFAALVTGGDEDLNNDSVGDEHESDYDFVGTGRR